MNTGKQIKELREKQGISIYRLSRLARIPETTIRNWENQGFEPTFINYQKIVNALGYEIELVKKGVNK